MRYLGGEHSPMDLYVGLHWTDEIDDELTKSPVRGFHRSILEWFTSAYFVTEERRPLFRTSRPKQVRADFFRPTVREARRA